MTFKLEFKTDTAAFDEDPADEISRILCQMTGRVRNGAGIGIIRDINDNIIGDYEMGYIPEI